MIYFLDADPASVAFRRVHNLKEDNITVVNQVRIISRKLGILRNIINQLKTVSNHFVLYLLFMPLPLSCGNTLPQVGFKPGT